MERAIQLRRRDLPLFARQSAFAPSPVATNARSSGLLKKPLSRE